MTDENSKDIDPMDATITEDFDPHMGQLVKVEAAGESYTLKTFGPRPTVVVGFHPEWVIEALERTKQYEPRKVTEEDVHNAQRSILGVDDDERGDDA